MLAERLVGILRNIEGAHEGHGTCYRFMRHIKRNSVLLFMISAGADRNIQAKYDILITEPSRFNFNADLPDKPRLLAIPKKNLLWKMLNNGL